ncbi:hypothetical protein V6N11_009362 [Hibiscus sabdariffa]|uniref:Uncharacterized protein n=1 Tax=Hibiscus sabdariffa TaxID=183260 RepID=A0ABR2NSJ9_9ROSI
MSLVNRRVERKNNVPSSTLASVHTVVGVPSVEKDSKDPIVGDVVYAASRGKVTLSNSSLNRDKHIVVHITDKEEGQVLCENNERVFPKLIQGSSSKGHGKNSIGVKGVQ